MSSGFTQYPFSEITNPMRDDPCCPQPLQLTDSPSPELFDQECDNNEEFGEFDMPADEINALFSSHRNTNPIINTKISTLSGFTDSTDSSYEIASSQYSFDIASSESDYLNPEFENYYSANNELQAFIPSDGFADPLPYVPAESHGTIDFTPNFPADGSSTVMHQLESVTCVNPAALTAHMISEVEAQMPPFKLECPQSPFPLVHKHDLETHVGTHDKDPNFSADGYSTAMQYVDPAAQSAHVISNAPQMTPVNKPYKCPHCQFCSARKHNLKTHVETHDKEASKRFECITCGRRFSRKHDLRRHRETIHRIPMPPSTSTSGGHRFHQRPDPLQRPTTAICGDQRLMSSSLHPGPFADTGLEDLVDGMQLDERT